MADAPPLRAADGAPATGMPDDRKWRAILTMADQQAKRDVTQYDKFLRLFRDGQYGKNEGEGQYDMKAVTANYSFAFVSMMLAIHYAQQPNIEVEPEDVESATFSAPFMPLVNAGMFPSVEDARLDFADALERYLTRSYALSRTNKVNVQVLFQALVKGLGWSKESFDEQTAMDRSDCLRREEVFVDPYARFDVSQAFYVVQTALLPVERAREFFSGKGVNPQAIQPNYDLSEGEGLSAEQAKKNAPKLSEKELFKFYEIWWKDGQTRNVEWRAWSTHAGIASQPWPFALSKDDFPFTPLSFNSRGVQIVDAFPDLLVVDGLRGAIEKVVAFCERHTTRSLAKKILVDSASVSEEKLAQILDPQDMRAVELKIKQGQSLDGAVRLLDFNSATDASFDTALRFKEMFDQITGWDELMQVSGSREMSATEADIREKYGKLRSGRRERLLDEYLETQCLHRANIAMQLVGPDKISAVAGDRAALLWQLYPYDPERFPLEYSIGIAAGSSGERAKQQRIDRLDRMMQRAVMVNQTRMQQGLPPAYDVQKIAEDIWKQDGIRRPQRYAAVPPPAPAQAPMAPEASGMAGPGIPPQQPSPEGVPA